MVLVRRIHNRGANIVVEANAEVLFAATEDVGKWTNKFSHRVGQLVRKEAPTNKRPRWGHYGKPLKDTITVSTSYHPSRMKVYSAVGSRAPHAYYVDQGTGIYNGSAPYAAKVLPPWHRGSPSLYEHTWRPGGPPNPKVAPVMIRGQKGQHFFDKGLDRAFKSLGDARFKSIGSAAVQSAVNSFPTGLANFSGNTDSGPAFQASLDEWRSWRDAAFNSDVSLGLRGGSRSQARRQAKAQATAGARAQASAVRKARRANLSKQRSQARRDAIKAMNTAKSTAKSTAKPKQVRKTPLSTLQRAEQAAKMEAVKFLNKPTSAGFRVFGTLHPWGFYYFDRGGTKHQHFWSIHTADLFADAGIRFRPPPKQT